MANRVQTLLLRLAEVHDLSSYFLRGATVTYEVRSAQSCSEWPLRNDEETIYKKWIWYHSETQHTQSNKGCMRKDLKIVEIVK